MELHFMCLCLRYSMRNAIVSHTSCQMCKLDPVNTHTRTHMDRATSHTRAGTQARWRAAVNRIGNQELDREQSAHFQVVYGYSYH